MAIDLNGLSSRAASSTSNRVNTRGSDNGAEGVKRDSASSATPETVRLSDQAQSLQKLESQVKELPDVDMDKVERIKRAIADGSYQADAQRTAAKMLNLENQLFG